MAAPAAAGVPVAEGGGALSIRCTSLTLGALLVACAGGIAGGLSFKAGSDAVTATKSTADRGIEKCFASGRANIVQVSGQMMNKIVDNLASLVDGYFRIPTVFAETVERYLRSENASDIASREWQEQRLYPLLNSLLRAGRQHGLTEVGVVTRANESADGSDIAQIVDFVVPTPSPFEGGKGTLTLAQRQAIRAGTDVQALTIFADDPMLLASVYVREDDGSLDWPATGQSLPKIFIPIKTYRLAQRGSYGAGFDHVCGPCVPGTTGSFAKPSIPGEIYWMPPESHGFWLSVPCFVALGHLPGLVSPVPGVGNLTGNFGYVLVSVDVESISDFIRGIELPRDSRLYAVRTDPYNGRTEALMGASHGESIIPLDCNVEMGDTICVEEVLAVNVSDPVIRAHARNVAAQGGYDGAEFAAAPQWAGPDDVLYDVKSRVVTNHWSPPEEHATGIRLHLVLLIQHKVLMEIVERETEVVRTSIVEENSATADDRDKANMVMIIMVVVIVAVLMVVLVVAVSLVIRPLQTLEGEMAEVALMHLDHIDDSLPLSRLAEVSNMQASFHTMVRNLREFRNYMPQSVLVEDDDGEASEGTQEEAGGKGSKDGEKNSSGKMSKKHSMDSIQSRASTVQHVAHKQDVMSAMELRKKKVSLVACNFRGFHAASSQLGDKKTVEFHTQYIAGLIATFSSHKGVPETFSGDRMLCTFNAVKTCSIHRTHAASSCIDARDATASGRLANASSFTRTKTAGGTTQSGNQQAPPSAVNQSSAVIHSGQVSVSAVSGDCRVGNMGCAGMKRFSFIGPAVAWGVALERYNASQDLRGLCDNAVLNEVADRLVTLSAGDIAFQKLVQKPLRVFELLRLKQVSEEEWMYQLKDGEGKGLTREAWDACWDAWRTGEWATAERAAEALPPDPEITDAARKRLLRFISGRTRPDEVAFH